MNSKITKTLTVCLLFAAVSCTKESMNRQSSSIQSSNNSESVASFSIGQHYHGGIIFYIDKTGKHGLIAVESDQGTQISWKKGPNTVTGATGVAVGTGQDNTNKIIAAMGSGGTYAAVLCANYESGEYKNWYLPSKAELDLLYNKMDVVGGFSATNYWSSTEVSKSKAWNQVFAGGFTEKDSKRFTLNVRAISSF